MEEKWENITNFEDRYMISNHGRVKSLRRNKIMKIAKHKIGYMQIGLFNGYKLEFKLVHRLVAQAFIPKPLFSDEVNHKDLDKTNNFDYNLEWVTHQENMNHAKKLGFRYASRI